MSKFERRFGRYAIRNISLLLILCYAAGMIIRLININFLNYLTLNPYEILFHGQIWRLVTWIIIPPNLSFDFFFLLMLYVYYSLGTSLERTWGTYRYNLYLFSGMLFTVIGSFLLMGYTYLFQPELAAAGTDPQAQGTIFDIMAIYFSTYYVNMSIFLAFAATFPEVQFRLFFILPIKVKYLGIIDAVLLAYDFFFTDGNEWNVVVTRTAIIASLLNFIIFFFTSRKMTHLSPQQIKRRHEYKRGVKKFQGITRHQCAVCGVTEEQDPTREFRFCSKCSGNYEYCDQHLYTHTHVKN